MSTNEKELFFQPLHELSQLCLRRDKCHQEYAELKRKAQRLKKKNIINEEIKKISDQYAAENQPPDLLDKIWLIIIIGPFFFLWHLIRLRIYKQKQKQYDVRLSQLIDSKMPDIEKKAELMQPEYIKASAILKEKEKQLKEILVSVDELCDKLVIPKQYRKTDFILSMRRELTKNYNANNSTTLIGLIFYYICQKDKEEFDAKHQTTTTYTPLHKGSDIEGPSTWYDYRTGERLMWTYDGRIVNSKGEEVSSAWWE